MYTKLFAKILTSSVWTYDYATRIVWVTLLAAMDEDGFAHYATVKNLAAVAQVTPDEAAAAVAILEGPDAESSDPANHGRRIERVPGGWLVLNAKAYRSIQRRSDSREATAERVRRYRLRVASGEHVTVERNAPVTAVTAVTVERNGAVTHVTAHTDTDTDTDTERSVPAERSAQAITGGSPTGDRKYEKAFDEFWTVYPRKTAKQAAARAYAALRPSEALRAQLVAAVRLQAATQDWQKDGGRFVPHAATWLRGRRWEDLPVGASTATPAAGTGQASTAAETELEKADREYWRRVRETQAYTAKIAQMEEETRAELAERGDEIRAHWARLREELAAKARAKAGGA